MSLKLEHQSFQLPRNSVICMASNSLLLDWMEMIKKKSDNLRKWAVLPQLNCPTVSVTLQLNFIRFANFGIKWNLPLELLRMCNFHLETNGVRSLTPGPGSDITLYQCK